MFSTSQCVQRSVHFVQPSYLKYSDIIMNRDHVTCPVQIKFMIKWITDDQMNHWWSNESLMIKWITDDQMNHWWSNESLMIKWITDDQMNHWWSNESLMIKWITDDQMNHWWSNESLMIKWIIKDQIGGILGSRLHSIWYPSSSQLF